MLDNKTIFISGGSGSFGQAFIRHVLKNYSPKKIIIFSRGEDLQRRTMKDFAEYADIVRPFIGDIRDLNRIEHIMRGADIVIHAAALKDLYLCSKNPIETIKTNAIGTANMVEACAGTDTVEKAIFLSTDKAVSPENLYGASKMLSEKLWLDANYISPKFSVCRYGNVVRSRGLVLNVWLDKRNALKEHEELVLELTHEDMTRFWLEYSDAIGCVKHALSHPYATTVISKTRAFILMDLLIAFDAGIRITGMRPGEKLHETLIGEHELHRAVEYSDHYILKPETKYREIMPRYAEGQAVEYPVTSQNARKMSVEELRRKIG